MKRLECCDVPCPVPFPARAIAQAISLHAETISLNLTSVCCAVYQVGASGAVDRSVHLRRVPSVVPARCAGAVRQHRMGRTYVYQYLYQVRQPAGVARSLKHLPGHPLSR